MKKVRIIKEKISAWLCRYINGTKGAITLFLALLMMPFVMITGALLNLGRFNSAIAIFDESLCNASNSTLGTYDKFLRSRFGLLAISQDFPDEAQGYTADDFISETFEFYMEQNGLSLSSTYITMDLDAAGIYPLADTDVLASQTKEYGKYSVPLKLVIDGFNLDDILGSLTKKLNLATSIFSFVSTGADTVVAIDDFDEKITALQTTIDNCTAANKEYKQAFTNLKQSVTDYNKSIDALNKAVRDCKAAISQAKQTREDCEKEVKKLTDDPAHSSIIATWERMRTEKNPKTGKRIYTDAQVRAYENAEANKETIKLYKEAKTALDNAVAAVGKAEQKLIDKKAEHTKIVAAKRADITTKKNSYITEIGELQAQVRTLNSSISGAQIAASTLVSKTSDCIKNTANLGFAIAGQASDNKIEDLKEKQKEAKTQAEKDKIDTEMTQVKDDKTVVSNIKTGLTSGNPVPVPVTNLEDFATKDYRPDLTTINSKLEEIKGMVPGISVPAQADPEKKMSAIGDSYYYAVNLPIAKSEIEKLLEDIFAEVTASAVLTILKGIVGFIKAILEMLTEIGHDHELEAVLDPSKYSDIGGLPSYRSQASFQSSYLKEDKVLSDKNKEILGEYSNTGTTQSGIASLLSTAMIIIEDITIISNTLFNKEWNIKTFIGNIKTIAYAIIDIGSQILSLLGSLGELLKNIGSAAMAVSNAVYSKALLAGYIGYNTSNRTTWEGKALTGATFKNSLPSTVHDNADGYAFYGAETEYIILGSTSETDNQRFVYYTILMLRIIYNTIIVWGCGEAQSVATAAGSVTFGIGYVVVMVLWILAESFLDAVVLCNGGGINYLKTTMYLSAAGIPSLVSDITSLSLTSAMKKSVSNACSDAMGKMATNTKDPTAKAEIERLKSATFPSGNGTSGSATTVDPFKFDYTKILMLYMLFIPSDSLLRRLADVIQMEATWNQKQNNLSSRFDLGKSYTYIRASGTFETNQFIKTSEDDGFTSPLRIVYRGY